MAEFYMGFVFEYGVSAPLTIEGNPIDIKEPTRGHNSYRAALPSGRIIEARTISGLARRFIRGSGMVDRRDRECAQHVQVLRQGSKVWNSWRRDKPHIRPALAHYDLASLRGRPVFDGYDFSHTNLCMATLRGLSLRGANFHQAILAKADLTGAHLEGANFCRTDLYETIFARAHLDGANLQGVQLARTDVRGAHLNACTVYGSSAWDLQLDEHTEQNGLRIRYRPVAASLTEDEIPVDGLDLASFMYFTLANPNIARVIEATTKKWVLLLGRFTPGKGVLHALAEELRARRLIPVIFDFGRPETRDLGETVVLLAGLSAFIIVDITSPRSTPMELQAIAPNFGVPIVPIAKKGASPFATFSSLRRFRWVHEPVPYASPEGLVKRLGGLIDWATAEARLRPGARPSRT